jgi:hypothetical protein
MMLYSDSTQLTQLANGQKAWLVYLTIANIDYRTRQSDKADCIIPIGFLGAPEADEKETVFPPRNFSQNSERFRELKRKLFADQMSEVFDSLLDDPKTV